jgi:hypothetical protein
MACEAQPCQKIFPWNIHCYLMALGFWGSIMANKHLKFTVMIDICNELLFFVICVARMHFSFDWNTNVRILCHYIFLMSLWQ